jgi:hypothetical protein
MLSEVFMRIVVRETREDNFAAQVSKKGKYKLKTHKAASAFG